MASRTEKLKIYNKPRSGYIECQEPKFRKPLTKIRQAICNTIKGKDDEDYHVTYIVLENEWILLAAYGPKKDLDNIAYSEHFFAMRAYRLRTITKLRPLNRTYHISDLIGCPVDPNSPFIQQLRLKAMEIPQLKEKCVNANA